MQRNIDIWTFDILSVKGLDLSLSLVNGNALKLEAGRTINLEKTKQKKNLGYKWK